MIAVVTGGVKGLGRSFTEYLLSLGYKVYAFYNSSEDDAKKLEEQYKNLTCIKCNIKNENEIIDAFYEIDEIDLLINNAATSNDSYFFEKTKEEFMDTLETNVVGTFLVSKIAFNRINKGTIINISSNNAIDNYNPISMDYDISKAGINLMTKELAMLKSNIKVFSICPGWINTDSIKEMNQDYLKKEMERSNQEKLIEPDELAKLIIDNIDNYESGSIIEIKEV